MTFQAQNIDSIINYFWDSFPTTTGAAAIRRMALAYLLGLGWLSKNFSKTAFTSAQNFQRQYRMANMG